MGAGTGNPAGVLPGMGKVPAGGGKDEAGEGTIPGVGAGEGIGTAPGMGRDPAGGGNEGVGDGRVPGVGKGEGVGTGVAGARGAMLSVLISSLSSNGWSSNSRY